MNVKINFPNLVRQELPPRKRQPNRLMLLRAYISPLVGLFERFDTWRDGMRIEMNMTGQAGVLEGYLRAKYNDSRIRVETFVDRGLAVGLPFEGVTTSVPVGLGLAEGSPAVVPLPGEMRDRFGDVDFVVYVPGGLSEAALEQMQIDIARYKRVLVKYKIIER